MHELSTPPQATCTPRGSPSASAASRVSCPSTAVDGTISGNRSGDKSAAASSSSEYFPPSRSYTPQPDAYE